METGIELIAKERQEQIQKHGFTKQHDRQTYDEMETEKYAEPSDLVVAANAAITAKICDFPYSWQDSRFVAKIVDKTYKERLIVAGALIAAEIDRITEKEVASIVWERGELIENHGSGCMYFALSGTGEDGTHYIATGLYQSGELEEVTDIETL